MIDDRDVRPGFKFKDADLIGIPLRITIGRKGLANGQIEMKVRGQSEMEMLAVDGATEAVVARLDEMREVIQEDVDA